MKKVEEFVEYGLDQFDPERTVEIPLRDALYAYKAIGEFIAFFHQPLNYPTLEAVERFIGTADSGGFHILAEVYYKRLRDVWPADVRSAIENGDLDLDTALRRKGTVE